MSDIALYHPYTHFRDETWLKAAALHWPKVGRLLPASSPYFLQPSDTERALRDSTDFIVDVDPGLNPNGSDRIDDLMYRFLDARLDELLPRYGLRATGVELPPDRQVSAEPIDAGDLHPKLMRIAPAKMSVELTHRLRDAGLLVAYEYVLRPPGGEERVTVAMGMHRTLWAVYLAVLAGDIAERNRMATVTDRPAAQVAVTGWTIDALAEVLLDDSPRPPRDDPGVEHAFTILALETVLPGGLEHVPVSRVIEARERLLPSLIEYRAFLDSLAGTFAEVAATPDPAVREARLGSLVQAEVKRRTEAAEREIRRLGLQPVRAVLSAQTLTPPALLASLMTAAGLPGSITVAGAAAGCLAGAAASAFSQRAKVADGHPTGYLLALKKELTPGEAVAGARRAFRRVTGRIR